MIYIFSACLNFLFTVYDFIVLWLTVKPKQDFDLSHVPKAPDYTNYKNYLFGGWMAFDLPDKRQTRDTNLKDKDEAEVRHTFDVDIFYVHPTSYGIFGGTAWNGPTTDLMSNFISYFNEK